MTESQIIQAINQHLQEQGLCTNHNNKQNTITTVLHTITLTKDGHIEIREKPKNVRIVGAIELLTKLKARIPIENPQLLDIITCNLTSKKPSPNTSANKPPKDTT